MKRILLLLLAVLLVQPVFGQDGKTLKRKVAIGRFTNETQYAKGLFYDRDNDPMRKQALDLLSAKLASSGKFLLLERDGLEELVAEAGEGMQKIGADYIILGSITKFGRKVEGDQRIFSQTKTQTVEAGVSIRLVDVSSVSLFIPMRHRDMQRLLPRPPLVLAGQRDTTLLSATKLSRRHSRSLWRISSTNAWTNHGEAIFSPLMTATM